MLLEPQLVPFHSTDLTGRSVLVIAPHPDDETFGCGGALALHRGAGDPVRVLFVTNGAKGDSSGTADRDEYVARRQGEARDACADLGIDDLAFWTYEDRETAHCPDLVARLAAAVEDLQPALVYTPSPYEIHPDHRALAHWLLAAVSRLECRFDIAFYEVSQAVAINCLVDISAVMEVKMQAMDRYSSQLTERHYKKITLALNQFRTLTLDTAVQYAEGFLIFASEIFMTRSFQQVYSDHLSRWQPTFPDQSMSSGATIASDLPHGPRFAPVRRWLQALLRTTSGRIPLH